MTYEQEESDQGNPCKSRTTANPDEEDFRQTEITNGSSTHNFRTPRSKIKPWERWQEPPKQHPSEDWKLSQGFQLGGTDRRSRWILEAMHPLHESKMSKRANEQRRDSRDPALCTRSRMIGRRNPKLLDHEPQAISPDISIPNRKRTEFLGCHPGHHPWNLKEPNHTRSGNYWFSRLSRPNTLRRIRFVPIHNYGSSIAAVRDGGGGMYTRNKWKESSSSPPTEKHSTSLKAEALRAPTTEIQNKLPRAHIFIGVFLALHSLQKDYLNELTTVL